MSGLNKDQKANKGFWFRLRRKKLFLNSVSCCLRKNPDEDLAVSKESRNLCCSGYQVESLRIVMEKNDFFSKECNTHFDVGSVSGASE